MPGNGREYYLRRTRNYFTSQTKKALGVRYTDPGKDLLKLRAVRTKEKIDKQLSIPQHDRKGKNCNLYWNCVKRSFVLANLLCNFFTMVSRKPRPSPMASQVYEHFFFISNHLKRSTFTSIALSPIFQPFTCGICSIGFTKRNNAARHIQHQHNVSRKSAHFHQLIIRNEQEGVVQKDEVTN